MEEIIIADQINLELIDQDLNIKASQMKVVEAIWQSELSKKSLFNGKIIAYHSHHKINNQLFLKAVIIEYKLFLANLKNPSLKLPLYPIAVSGLILDQENNTLIAKRQNVTEYNGYYELVPAGSIDSDKVVGNIINFESQIVEEFIEETDLSQALIKSLKPFCLIFDHQHGVFDIGIKIVLKSLLNSRIRLSKTTEYSDIQLISLNDLYNNQDKYNLIPTSLNILKAAKL